MALVRRKLAAVLAGTAICAVSAVPARATSAAQAVIGHRFDIPAGPLASALKVWARQSGRSIVFRADELKDVRSKAVKGQMTSEDALNALLEGSGLLRMDDPSGAVAIMTNPDATSSNATPDILVNGRRSWSLNTGIERTQNDSQPFIVMTRDEIQRSGAPNLETFLRDRLNVNTAPGVSEQVKPGDQSTEAGRGLSSINLRGLGTRDTLILVDGRRQPGVNIGSGTITQASITGIPIAAIERIEVLASSASGIYGSGASGGVINIVLKRDFRGGELSASYGNTTDFAQGQGQVDLTYGLPIEGGRTRISLTGSWSKSLPLLYGSRYELARRSIDSILANDPDALVGLSVTPPPGRSVNYNSADGGLLTLKPRYGGVTLASRYGRVPTGFRGIAVDGVTPLLAGIGRYDYEPADTSGLLGRRSPLLYGSERASGSMTVRREFNSQLTGYLGATLSRVDSTDLRSGGPNYVLLSADAPNNPFTQNVQLTLSGVGRQAAVKNRITSTTLIGGVIAKLPAQWQAALDLSFSRSRFVSDIAPSFISDATVASLQNGGQNALRDLSATPLTLVYDNLPFYTRNTPALSSAFAPSLRVAGPLPVSFPGGRPQMTINVEYNDERIDAVRSALNREAQSTVTYVPAARQQTWSIYGEIAFPLIAEAMRVPLIRELELRISARAERYQGDGADPYTCASIEGPLPAGDPFGVCPPADAVIPRSITRNSHVDPSISFRWKPIVGVMVRGSYTTGYLPPTLASLVRQRVDPFYVSFTDPLRGNEIVGVATADGNAVSGFAGGNPEVRPESSRTYSAGVVLTPGFVPGLRFSADWTRIAKRDIYFSPAMLAPGFVPGSQAAFEQFIAANPGRVTRDAPSDGFTVGRITALDLSLVNLVGMTTNAIDFVVDYNRPLLGGAITLTSRATYVDSLIVNSFPGAPAPDYAGVVTSDFARAVGANGALRWRGSAAVTWTKDAITLGWQGRYFDRYALNVKRAVVPGQGSAFVSSQSYQDLSVSYRFDFGATLTVAVNNVFNRKPPIDISSEPVYYSSYADPRLRNFQLSIRKSF